MDLSHEANVPQSGLEEPSRLDAAKQKLGQIGRKLKRIEVRERIVAHPVMALGISAAVGGLVGLVRPMPHRGRVQSAAIAALSAIGIRLVRDAAMRQLGAMAKDWLENRGPGEPEIAYSPAYGDG